MKGVTRSLIDGAAVIWGRSDLVLIRAREGAAFSPLIMGQNRDNPVPRDGVLTEKFFSLIASVKIEEGEESCIQRSGGERKCLTGLHSSTLSSRFSRQSSMFCLPHNGKDGIANTCGREVPADPSLFFFRDKKENSISRAAEHIIPQACRTHAGTRSGRSAVFLSRTAPAEIDGDAVRQ